MKFITLEIIIMNIPPFEPFPELDSGWLENARIWTGNLHNPEQPIPLRGGGFCPRVTHVEGSSQWNAAKFHFSDPLHPSLQVPSEYHGHAAKLWDRLDLQRIYNHLEDIGYVYQRAVPLVENAVIRAGEAEKRRQSLLTQQTVTQSKHAERKAVFINKEKDVVDAKTRKAQLQSSVDSLKAKIVALQLPCTQNEEEKASLARQSIDNLKIIAGLEEKKSSLQQKIENQCKDTEKQEKEIFDASVESQQSIPKKLQGIEELLLTIKLQNEKKV